MCWSMLEEAVLLPTSQGKKVWLFIAYTLPLHTGVIVSLCQSVSASVSLISYGLHFPGGTKASRKMLAVDEVRRLCKTNRGLKKGLPGTNAVFLCCPI